MDDKHAGRATERSLKDVMRTIRVREAERTGVVVALRDAELARLDALKERLDPVIAQVPAGIDLFDTGLTPGDPPRLWIDMVSFIEMSRDKRIYRFLQDTRFGRTIIMESEAVDEVADAVTAYMAQRLIERERMLLGQQSPPSIVEPSRKAQPSPLEPVAGADVQSALATIRAAARDAAGASSPPGPGVSQPAPPEPAQPQSMTQPSQGTPAARLVAGSGSPVIGTAAEPPQSSAETAGPAPRPARRSRQEGVRFGWAAMTVVLLLGLAMGAGSVLAIAMLAARGG